MDSPKELVPLDGSVTLLWSEAIMLMLGEPEIHESLQLRFKKEQIFKLIIWNMGILHRNLLYLDIKN